ncbi:hypothetical protein EDB83DRAFT_838715 [Lactarius deliciosus]|nr:hypothetical protein EDB83DRAFT_838715 [Lactarius deliciosus]
MVVLPMSVRGGFGAETWTSGASSLWTCLDELPMGKQTTLDTLEWQLISRSLESGVYVCGGNKAPSAKAGLRPCHQSPSGQHLKLARLCPQFKLVSYDCLSPPKVCIELLNRIHISARRLPVRAKGNDFVQRGTRAVRTDMVHPSATRLRG